MCPAPPRMKRPLTLVTAVCELECFQEALGRELTLAAGVNSEPYLMDVGRVGLGLTMPPAYRSPSRPDPRDPQAPASQFHSVQPFRLCSSLPL